MGELEDRLTAQYRVVRRLSWQLVRAICQRDQYQLEGKRGEMDRAQAVIDQTEADLEIEEEQLASLIARAAAAER